MVVVDIEKLHGVLFEMLEEVDRICSKNGIKYSLFAGSALGAVRHGGFIPWDDDLDIVMLRPDYEKFLKLTGYNPIKPNLETRLYDFCTNKNIYPFAKVIDNKTVVYEKGKSKKNISGIWIDIFPLDGFPENVNKAKKLFNKYLTLRNFQDLATTKPFYANQNLFKKIIKTLFVAPIVRLYDVKKICRKMDLLAQSYSYEDSNLVSDVTWGDNIESYIKKSELEPAITVEFEKHLFKAPCGWNEYLTRLYGDYMQLPPENERITHGFVAYQI